MPELQEIHGIETMRQFLKEHFAAFPDWHEKIELILAEGGKVAYITTGTQTGKMGNSPPGGKRLKVTNLIIHRIENGKMKTG